MPVLCTGLAAAYALYTPESFKAETLVAPAQEENSGTPLVLSQFGGLATIAGISIPYSSKNGFWQHWKQENSISNLFPNGILAP